MLKYSKGQKISLNLTLINNDGSPESNANISYEVYDDNNVILSNNNLSFNKQLGSYVDIIDPDTDWIDQKEGIYHIKWYINNTIEDYPENVVENLYIERYDEKLDKILGLVHQNIFIDETEYDEEKNMTRARLTIYKTLIQLVQRIIY